MQVVFPLMEGSDLTHVYTQVYQYEVCAVFSITLLGIEFVLAWWDIY